jgi:hypothetical protein
MIVYAGDSQIPATVHNSTARHTSRRSHLFADTELRSAGGSEAEPQAGAGDIELEAGE